MHDAKLGRFMGIDLPAEDYFFQLPYAYAANNPIKYVDLYGVGSSFEGGSKKKGKKTTQIKQRFKFDETAEGKKMGVGTGIITNGVSELQTMAKTANVIIGLAVAGTATAATSKFNLFIGFVAGANTGYAAQEKLKLTGENFTILHK